MIRIILFQPDIPQNVGAVLRLAACFGIGLDIIEPCGFVWDDKRLRRAGMDYAEQASIERHTSWQTYHTRTPAPPGRLILLTTKASVPYHAFTFKPNDRLLFGRESAGVPEEVHGAADSRLVIPMAAGARSLNLAQSAAIVAAEALRQLDHWPAPQNADSRT